MRQLRQTVSAVYKLVCNLHLLIQKIGVQRPIAFVVAISLYSSGGALAESVNDQVKEYQIKSLFLYNFANFVEWPDQAFPDADAPLKLCLIGSAPLGGFLESVNGTPIGNRQLSVVRRDDQSDESISSGCHILFVGFDQANQLESLFTNLNHTFVLSVGSEPGFAEDWGTINIFRVKDGAQIDINLKKAMENELKISSDLLAISRVIQ